MSSGIPAHVPECAGRNTIDLAWKGLYRVGGVAALLVATFVPAQVVVFVLSPPPSTVIGWFALFRDSPLLGLLDMDLLLIADQVLSAMVLLALFTALRHANRSLMVVALAAALLGIAAYVPSNTAFEMLSISNQYSVATGEAEKATLLAAGQSALVTWTGTAFSVGYVLLGIGLLLTAVVMLKSGLFGRPAALIGLALGAMSLIPASAGTVGRIFALGSLLPLEAWYILIGAKLVRLGGVPVQPKIVTTQVPPSTVTR